MGGQGTPANGWLAQKKRRVGDTAGEKEENGMCLQCV